MLCGIFIFCAAQNSCKSLTWAKSMESVFENLKDTCEGKIAAEIEKLYAELEKQQSDWYKKTKFTCNSGCGMCCHNFEPDLTEAEANFMVLWLIQNQRQTAEKLLEENENPSKTCIFFNAENDYHCSIYGARPFICRLFGASSFYSKNRSLVWRPCKFYPEEKLSDFGLSHRQYSKDMAKKILGEVPPAMSDIMAQAMAVSPENKSTEPLRKILPRKIQHIFFLLKCCGNV